MSRKSLIAVAAVTAFLLICLTIMCNGARPYINEF